MSAHEYLTSVVGLERGKDVDGESSIGEQNPKDKLQFRFDIKEHKPIVH